MNKAAAVLKPNSSVVIAFVLSLPLFALIVQAFSPDDAIFSHLASTVLADYVVNTLLLVFLVSVLSFFIGVPLAWLMSVCDFPLRRTFEWALMLPLAMPAYIIAYTYTDLLDYAGPVQIALRNWFGWQSPDDYWFFEIRSLGGAACMLALVLFPYVYIMCRATFIEQSNSLINASRVLGCTPWQSFWKVSLPLARGTIIAAIALIGMETVADFATVHYFSVSTLTTAVYDTWLGHYSLAAAAKLSVVMLGVIFLLLALEKYHRRKREIYQGQQPNSETHIYQLSGLKGWLVTIWCSLVLAAAFIIPMAILLNYAVDYFDESWNLDVLTYASNSFIIALVVSGISLVVALWLNFRKREQSNTTNKLSMRFSSTGYALPGTVLAIGVLVPLTAFDTQLNNFAEQLGMPLPGLLFSGTVFAIVFAYVVRFAAIAITGLETSFSKISPSLDMVGKTMGCSGTKALIKVHVPLVKKTLFSCSLLIFIECLKELPAALLLRPFDFETLATYTYQFASDEQLELAAFAALTIVVVGLIPLFYINQSIDSQ
ncbi:ABC transporter permease [Flocculibacter collagenilyticus]|uniref:ABC transporter permease n=1 Tax=Flocculibacter collagenilyticus TaxID=2744479 RepID=UPI0018F56450|nr:iron ABC transporter permease [Flocculibacter collagenilyticus]